MNVTVLVCHQPVTPIVCCLTIVAGRTFGMEQREGQYEITFQKE